MDSKEENYTVTQETADGNGSSYAYTDRKAQKLDRYITLKPAVAFGLTVLSSWSGIGLTIFAALLSGGPTCLIWGTLLVGIGTLSIAASLAELASITPVVGAQYRWTGLYAPKFMSPAFWSLLQGWLTVFSWISLIAAIPFACAFSIQGLIAFNNVDYIPKRWHVTLIMWAFLLVPVLCNVWGRRLLKYIEIGGAVFFIVGFIVVCVTLIAMSERSSAEFVFTESFFGITGWNNKAIEWCIGLLSITVVLTGFDGVLHLSDEITNAPKKVPKAMVWSVVLNSTTAFVFLLIVLFCFGDVMKVTTSPWPIIQIFYQTTKSLAGATVLTTILLCSTMVCLFGTIASVSRLTWSFAKDNGLPFSNFFAQVHPTLRIPLNSIGLVTFVAMLLSLINIGSNTAFLAILSLASLGLYLSYTIPIIFVLAQKLQGNHPAYGPWNLGKFGIPINIFASCFGIFICIFVSFPLFLPVDKNTMNYAAPIVLGIIFFAIIHWFVSARKTFEVPTEMPQ